MYLSHKPGFNFMLNFSLSWIQPLRSFDVALTITAQRGDICFKVTANKLRKLSLFWVLRTSFKKGRRRQTGRQTNSFTCASLSPFFLFIFHSLFRVRWNVMHSCGLAIINDHVIPLQTESLIYCENVKTFHQVHCLKYYF